MNQELAFVAVDSINVDHSYQRQISMPRVTQIARAVEIGAVKAVSLSRRADGSLWVYDGQHTVAALREAGRTLVPAVIVSGTREQEAAWFLLINGGASKRVSQRDKLAPGIVSGNAAATLVGALLHRHGVTVKKGGASAGRKTNAVGLLTSLAASSPDALHRAMDFIGSAWGDLDLAWSGRIISGVAALCRCSDGDAVLSALAKRGITPQRIEDAIAALQSVQGVASAGGWALSERVMRTLSGVK